MQMKKLITVAGLLLFTPVVSAHTGIAHDGIAAGFMHPLLGWDHLLAMLAIGFWAARCGGRASWAVPLTFVAVMTATALWGMQGGGLLNIESGIAVSLLLLGLLLAFAVRLPLAVGMPLVGLFAIYHGAAHGAEWPVVVAPAVYVAGFVLTTSLLHVAGYVMGRSLYKQAQLVSRLVGLALAGSGSWLLLAS
jgi:urease accessory protein